MTKNSQNNKNIKKVKYGFGEPIVIEKDIARVGRSSNKLLIPSKLDEDLAYLTGYHLGDGYLSNIYTSFNRKRKSDYEITYADADHAQISHINKIIKEKFHYELSIKKRNNIKMWIGRASCKVLHWFLNQRMNIPMGKRINTIIPNWIYSKNTILADFISGFFDAEADIGVKRYKVKERVYMTIRLQLTQKEIYLLFDIKKALKKYFNINSDIHQKWNQDAYILRINARNSINQFYEKINFKNQIKNEKLCKLLKEIPYKHPRKLK